LAFHPFHQLPHFDEPHCASGTCTEVRQGYR
jgi:hypothetical protein